MKTCPDEGRLRAWVDGEDPDIDGHLVDCADCRRARDALQSNARAASEAIATLQPAWAPSAAATEDALALAQPGPTGAVHSPATRRWHGRLRRIPTAAAAGIVALGLVAALILTPTGRQAAATFLASFRAESLTVVTFDPEQSLAGFDALGRLARVTGDTDLRQVEVQDLNEAASVAGFQPAAANPASLPEGLEAPAAIIAAEPQEVRLHFSADRAPELPENLDGATLVVAIPGIVMQQYAAGNDFLLVGEAGQLTAEFEGEGERQRAGGRGPEGEGEASLDELRQYLLTRPEVPDEIAEQLLAVDDWATTLPIPIPANEVGWEQTTVNGRSGLRLEHEMGNGMLWQGDGRMHFAGGTLTADDLRRVIDGLDA